MNQKQKTYQAKVRCMNCGWAGDLTLPFGEPVVAYTKDFRSFIITSVPKYRRCERCGLNTLNRDERR